jgi:aminodeoxyfutalosine deaminase
MKVYQLEMPMTSPDVTAFLHALPKVELHVHLLGSASVPTVLELAGRHPDSGVPADEQKLADFYEFRDFAHFIDVYAAVNTLVRTAGDITALVVGLARDLSRANVRYAEVTVTPVSHLREGIDSEHLAAALNEGRRRASAEHSVALGWVFDTPGEFGLDAAWDTLAWVRRHEPDGTVGYGLGGPEIGIGRAQFARPFTVAREAGLRSLPHAGETAGPASIWSALHDLGADRIGHGIQATADPRLLDYLAEHCIALEVCPTSNLRTGAVRSIEEHPLPRLLQWGVPVTLNTDDPGMFGTDLTREYRIVHEVFGLTIPELAHIARTAITAAYCSDELRAQLLAELDQVARNA